MMNMMSGAAASTLQQAIDLMSILELARDAERHKAALQQLIDAKAEADAAIANLERDRRSIAEAMKGFEEASAKSAAESERLAVLRHELEIGGGALIAGRTELEDDRAAFEAARQLNESELQAERAALQEAAAAQARANDLERAEIAIERDRVVTECEEMRRQAQEMLDSLSARQRQLDAAIADAEEIRGRLRKAQDLIAG